MEFRAPTNNVARHALCDSPLLTQPYLLNLCPLCDAPKVAEIQLARIANQSPTFQNLMDIHLNLPD
jgi:hypothetical protein